MSESVEISIAEARRVFDLLEEMNNLFHQPMNFSNLEEMERFATAYYPEIRELYYQVVWDWLPEGMQSEIKNR